MSSSSQHSQTSKALEKSSFQPNKLYGRTVAILNPTVRHDFSEITLPLSYARGFATFLLTNSH